MGNSGRTVVQGANYLKRESAHEGNIRIQLNPACGILAINCFELAVIPVHTPHRQNFSNIPTSKILPLYFTRYPLHVGHAH